MGQISDFRTLLSTLSADALTRGKQFERVTKWWLENDPIHSRQIEKVWLWDEWPEYPGRDIGIDLVAQLFDGSLMAIQAKCVDESRSIPKSELGLEVHFCIVRMRLLIEFSPWLAVLSGLNRGLTVFMAYCIKV